MEKNADRYRVWDEFLAEWPIERLQTMTLDEYTNLNRKDAFVYWIEKLTENLGSIWGGSAFKWGIYRRNPRSTPPGQPGTTSDKNYSWYTNYGDTAQDAFETIRAGICEVARLAAEGKSEEIDQVDVLWPVVRWKIAFLYQDRTEFKFICTYRLRLIRQVYETLHPESGGKKVSRARMCQALIDGFSHVGDIFDISEHVWSFGGEESDEVDAVPDGGAGLRAFSYDVWPFYGLLNVVLHGPPGTGKTYHLRELMLESFSDTPDSSVFITFHPSMTYEDFIEGFRPKVNDGAMVYELTPGLFKAACETAVLQTGFEGGLAAFCALAAEERAERLEGAPPVVVCIDEINRGNIARIFGELITLIEPDKRLGAEHELIVTLPGSRELFGVPSNLYIIGTMNTADRSVVALDVALRRRFAFKSFPPDPSTLAGQEVEGVELDKLLEAINARLRVLRDDDHLIGHAFLLGVEDLKGLRRVFKTSIVPLLVEYFYEELGRVGLVLGGRFVRREAQAVRFARFEHDQAEELAERAVWSLVDVDTLGAEDFRSIYA